MNNICIPQPTHYSIVYTDSKGEQTTRRIVPTSVDEDSITAYCYHSHGIRTFKKAQISSITTTLNKD